MSEQPANNIDYEQPLAEYPFDAPFEPRKVGVIVEPCVHPEIISWKETLGFSTIYQCSTCHSKVKASTIDRVPERTIRYLLSKYADTILE